jgi:23S rRNA (pseudouridine1915-N3)-methyltransferase
VKLGVLCVGRLRAGPERELFERYAERATALGPSVGISGPQFREFEESRARSADERRAAERKSLLEAAHGGAWICALDERGAAKTSAAWADEIARARDSGVNSYTVLIGGPDGLAPEISRAARSSVAFGAMTWPHQLVRVMAAEQLYRCLTILAGHPYHRA